MQEVGPSVFFSLLVITVSFLPIFTLEATEGRLFKPLAFTKTYAMGFAALLSVTLTPALAALADPRAHPRARTRTRSTAGWCALYAPVVRFVVRRRGVVIGAALLAARERRCPRSLALGSEFMPPLNEGTLLYMPTAPPGMSVDRGGARAPAHGPRAARSSPRSRACSARSAAPRPPTDPAPLSMVETVDR